MDVRCLIGNIQKGDIMDREQYFASKLEAGQYLTQTELEELIYSFDIDNIKTVDNMVPVGFNGRVWLVGFNPNPLWLFQPVEAEEYDPREWYPIINLEELSKQYMDELTRLMTLAENSIIIEVNPECVEAL